MVCYLSVTWYPKSTPQKMFAVQIIQNILCHVKEISCSYG